MRRPIFTTGRPQIVTEFGETDFLDLRSLNTELQSYVRFVTVYMANQTQLSADIMTIFWQEGTGTPVELTVANAPGGGFMAGGVFKALDRFPLQGDARLYAVGTEGSVPAVWGYFELDGSTNADLTTRGLLPGALVSPFTYVPVSMDNGDPAETLQQFDADYYDLITLDVSSSGGGAAFSKLAISDGAGTTELKVATGTLAQRIFDGIPMGAMSSSGSPGITLDVNTNTFVHAFGSFMRVS